MRRWFALGLALLSLLSLAACGSGAHPQEAAAQPTPIETWPENEFTSQLPELPGTPSYEIDQSSQDRFSVFYEQVDEAACQDWLDQLQQAGFTRKAEASEEGSRNYLLERDGVYLSVSWTGDMLGVAISMEASACQPPTAAPGTG